MPRTAKVERDTRETRISLKLTIEGSGKSRISTGIQMFDHLLTQIPRHGVFDLDIAAEGKIDPDFHHLVEDVAISLGKAFSEALGDRAGIVRMGSAIVPLDEALALVAVDFGGRPYAVVEAVFSQAKVGDLPADLIRHFLESLAAEARMNIHAQVLKGINDHHKAEALFKALARALDQATTLDPRISGQVPSTKGKIEG